MARLVRCSSLFESGDKRYDLGYLRRFSRFSWGTVQPLEVQSSQQSFGNLIINDDSMLDEPIIVKAQIVHDVPADTNLQFLTPHNINR